MRTDSFVPRLPTCAILVGMIRSQNNVTETLLAEMTDEIVRAVHPERIILFGSCARGTAGPDSDVDLLIVEDEPFSLERSRKQETLKVWRLLDRFPVAKDVLVFSREEIERWRHTLNHVVGRALSEGRVLYARP